MPRRNRFPPPHFPTANIAASASRTTRARSTGARFTSRHLSEVGCYQHDNCCVLGDAGFGPTRFVPTPGPVTLVVSKPR